MSFWLLSFLALRFRSCRFCIGSVRNNGRPLRFVGASALLGIALHNLWLFAPLMTAQSILAAVIAFIAMTGALVAVQRLGRRFIPEGRRSDV